MLDARLVLAILIAGLACVPMAAGMNLGFAQPATISGETIVGGARWLAVRIPEGATIDLEGTGSSLVYTNVTYPARVDTPVSGSETAPTAESTADSRPVAPRRLVAKGGGATIAMLLDDRFVGFGSMTVVSLGEVGVSGLVDDPGARHGWSSWSRFASSGVALVGKGPFSFGIDAAKVSAIEWFNVALTCDSSTWRPTGGGHSATGAAMSGFGVSQDTYMFERAEGDLRVTFHESALAQVVAAGQGLDVTTIGTVHLPVASGTPCEMCADLDQQTLALSGTIHLNDLRVASNGFQAEITGSFESVRVDEDWVPPTTLGAWSAAAAATFGVAVVLKFLLAPLFTRLSKEQALEHPKRQKIFQYIQQHPGANFREVARETEIAAGTVRHHLTVLERAGHIVEHQHQGTVRLFENHGKFDHNWSDMVLLREPALAELHLWLKQNPGSPQKDVLEAMEALGWSRSTTQHRLTRLVDGGLATIRLQGRLKLYTASEKSAPRPIGAAALVPAGSLAS